jgi:hypothetical protein
MFYCCFYCYDMLWLEWEERERRSNEKERCIFSGEMMKKWDALYLCSWLFGDEIWKIEM